MHSRGIKTVNVESLRLYRDVVRSTRYFRFPDSNGKLWSNVLLNNARKEFEQARFENDPLIIGKLLVVGRDALNQVMEKHAIAAKAIKDNIDRTRTS
eukprot:gene11938-15979_t